MALLRKAIVMPIEGVDYSRPAIFGNPRGGFPKNMRFWQNEMRKRPGKTQVGTAATGQIMGLGKYEIPGAVYSLRASKTLLQKWNTTTSVWDTLNLTLFTGGDEDFFNFAMIPEHSLLALTNGVDVVRKWLGSGNIPKLGGSPPICKYMDYLEPYLILGDITSGGTRYNSMVQWPDTDAPETWSGGNSGSQLLTGDPTALKQLKRLNEYMAAYKKDSLWLGRKVSIADTIVFDCMKTGIGLASSRALAEAEGLHYFMGAMDFYRWNGSQPEPIGGSVRDNVFSRVDRDKIDRCFALHVQELGEIWFFIVVSGADWPCEVWKYNYKNGFWYFDTCSNLTAAMKWEKYATETWDDDTGTWDEDLTTWDEGISIKAWEEILFGDKDGIISRLDYTTANDMGSAVEGVFETVDYIGAGLEFYTRFLQLDLEVRGSYGAKLYIDYSVDYGDTWVNIPYSSTQSYITLNDKYSATPINMYFDVVSRQIRLRLRNAESSELFYVRAITPYFLAREETRSAR